MILDTNALSAFVGGDADVAARLSAAFRVALPVIVLGEFRYGIMSSRHRRTYEHWLDEYLSDFEILPAVRASLKKTGHPIPANDVWIAALAMQHRLPVLSRDEHFDVVPGVKRETW